MSVRGWKVDHSDLVRQVAEERAHLVAAAKAHLVQLAPTLGLTPAVVGAESVVCQGRIESAAVGLSIAFEQGYGFVTTLDATFAQTTRMRWPRTEVRMLSSYWRDVLGLPPKPRVVGSREGEHLFASGEPLAAAALAIAERPLIVVVVEGTALHARWAGFERDVHVLETWMRTIGALAATMTSYR